jgi:hypothetical protein
MILSAGFLGCHAERSEASSSMGREMLSAAKHDKAMLDCHTGALVDVYYRRCIGPRCLPAVQTSIAAAVSASIKATFIIKKICQ